MKNRIIAIEGSKDRNWEAAHRHAQLDFESEINVRPSDEKSGIKSFVINKTELLNGN